MNANNADNIILDGVAIAIDIKKSAKTLKRSVKSIFAEAGISYRTYISWRSGQNNPSFASLKPVYAILRKGEDDL